MKKIFFLFFILSCFSSVSVWGEEVIGVGETKFQQNTDRLLVQLLIQDWRGQFAKGSFAPGEVRLEKEMRQNAKACTKIGTAREAAKKWFMDELRSQYQTEIRKIVEPFANSFAKDEINTLCNGDEKFFKQCLDKWFEPVFNKIRTSLVQEQKKIIFQKTYPSPEELEKNTDAQLEILLIDRLTKKSNQELMEENAELLKKDIVSPVISSGRKQQKRQLELVNSEAVPGYLWDQKQIVSVLSKSIEENIVREFPDESSRYALFPNTVKKIAERAEKIPAERAIAAISTETVAGKYREIIENSPNEHAKAEESFALAFPILQNGMRQDALKKADVPESMQTQVSSDQVFLLALKNRLNEQTASLQEQRELYSKDELKQKCPELAAGTWAPALEETDAFVASGMSVLPDLNKLCRKPLILQETTSLAQTQMRQALDFETSRLELQYAATQDVYQDVLEKGVRLQNEKMESDSKQSWFSKFFTSPSSVTLQEIIDNYRTLVINQSSFPLFPSMEKEIEIQSRAILQQVLQPKTSPDTTKNKKENKIKNDVIIELVLAGEEPNLQLMLPEWHGAYSSEKKQMAELVNELKKLVAKKSSEGPVKIRLAVADKKIYYKTVADLKKALRLQLKELEIEDSMQTQTPEH